MIFPLEKDRIKALCFDIDGTLRDTDDQMVTQLSHLGQRIKWFIPGLNPDLLARKTVMALEEPGNYFLHLLDFLGIDDEIAALGNFFNHLGFFKPKVHSIIQGTIKTLKDLQPHYQLAIVSARNQRVTQSFLDYFGLNEFFICVINGQTCRHTKPHPEPVEYAAWLMNLPTSACAMIGDTTVDVYAGKTAGAQTIAVLSGFGEKEELRRAGADLIINSVADLPPILLAGKNTNQNEHQ
jgi:phosphoglycolate phosphatase-like HAD superfamily hydrolase